MKRNKTLKLALTALMTALTAVATLVIQVPIPSTEGYVNIGDTVIFVTASLLGPIPAMAAGGIGSAIADLIVAPHWALPTLLIKGAEGLITALIISAIKKSFHLSRLTGMLAGGVTMVIGYYFFGAAFYGWAGSLASSAFNLVQMAVSVAAGYAISFALSKISALKDVIERTKQQ